jgi:phosphoribosyl-ATP pyrophosphohydrolase
MRKNESVLTKHIKLVYRLRFEKKYSYQMISDELVKRYRLSLNQSSVRAYLKSRYDDFGNPLIYSPSTYAPQKVEATPQKVEQKMDQETAPKSSEKKSDDWVEKRVEGGTYIDKDGNQFLSPVVQKMLEEKYPYLIEHTKKVKPETMEIIKANKIELNPRAINAVGNIIYYFIVNINDKDSLFRINETFSQDHIDFEKSEINKDFQAIFDLEELAKQNLTEDQKKFIEENRITESGEERVVYYTGCVNKLFDLTMDGKLRWLYIDRRAGIEFNIPEYIFKPNYLQVDIQRTGGNLIHTKKSTSLENNDFQN